MKPLCDLPVTDQLQHERLPVNAAPVIRDFTRCPRCGAPTEKSTSYTGNISEFWWNCTECNTYINTYIPQKHQEAVHRDNHTYIGNFGAYGTGKTTTSREEVYKHAFITPNANILIGANVQSQYEQTIKREMEADIPAEFVEYFTIQKQYMDLVNGARIMYRPFDDADKLRSYNLSMFVGVEASEFKSEVFHQLKTRLRNTSASIPVRDEFGQPLFEYDDRGQGIPLIKSEWRRGIIESNPDSGWIRTDVLLASDQIHKHGSVMDFYDQTNLTKDPATSTHIASTDTNKFLPKNFILEQIINKPKWWIARFIYGSFSYAEGLVYPSAIQHVVPAFEIPTEWRRIIAFDYGLADDAVYIFAAVDPKDGILYAYKEVRCNDMNLDSLAALYHTNIKDIPSGGLICQPIMDPKSGSKRDYNKDSLQNLFLQRGISFKLGYINIDARILRLNTYFESGKLKIMDCCVGLISELREYKFKMRTLDAPNAGDKPEDKKNHGINPLEWIAMELPSDPRNLLHGAYNGAGLDLTVEQARRHWMPHALMDPDEYNDSPRDYSAVSMENIF